MKETDTQAHEMEGQTGTDGGIESQTAVDEVVNEIADGVLEQIDDNQAVDIQDRRPEWVWDQYVLKHREDDKAYSSIQPIHSAWSQFTEWMQKEQGYKYLSELTSNFVGRHDDWVLENTHKNKLSRCMHLSRIKSVIKYAEARGWVAPSDVPDDETWNEIKPDLKHDDKVRSDPLRPERGERITKWVRANHFGERPHILWLLLYRYGLRVSAIQALDKDDVCLTKPNGWDDEQPFEPHLDLDDRPELGGEESEGLQLKNSREELAGRLIPLRPGHVDVFRTYLKEHRIEHEEPDKYGLCGLVSGQHGPRLSDRTIRARSHWLTCPGTYSTKCHCDGCKEYRDEHGREPYPSNVGTHCNETRSPHQVRHGSITSLLDDHDHATVARIVGTSTDTIRDVYDSAGEIRRMNRIKGDWLD